MYATGSYMQFRNQARYPKPRATGEAITCDVCKITVRGQDQYNSHLKGAKHLKKVKEQENTKKVEDNPHLRFDEYNGLYECTVCNVSLNSSSVAMYHIVGSRHQESVKSQKTAETSAGNVPAPEVMETSNENGTAEQAKTEQVNQPNKAGVLQNSGLQTDSGSTKVVATNNSNQPVQTHKANTPIGPAFKYNVKPLACNFVSKYTTHTVEATVSSGMNSAPRPRKKSNAGPTAKGQEFPCLACNIVTNSEIQLQSHLSSEKHKSRLGPGSGGPNGRHPNFPPPQPMSYLRCESCNISVNSQMQLDQHLQSPKHRYKLQMRYQPYPRQPHQLYPGPQYRRPY